MIHRSKEKKSCVYFVSLTVCLCTLFLLKKEENNICLEYVRQTCFFISMLHNNSEFGDKKAYICDLIATNRKNHPNLQCSLEGLAKLKKPSYLFIGRPTL